jgi:hypothetical protein
LDLVLQRLHRGATRYDEWSHISIRPRPSIMRKYL